VDEMKRLFFMIGIATILTGCSFDTILHKLSFQQEEEGRTNTDKVETSLEGETENQSTNKETHSEEDNSKLTLEAAYFNEITQVNGRNVIQNPSNILILVNKEYGLPDGYSPEDLVRPNVTFSFGNQDIEKSYMRKEAATALEQMFTDALQNGVQLAAVSGYRSYDRQVNVFNAEVEKVGEEQAVQVVAYPGNSEHQTGLAMDISSASANYELSEQFGETPEGKWIAENAHRFGFIMRYPKGKEQITGYDYESWHFRYVGIKAATEIYENQLTLEEYFRIVEKI
jgi:zinc D-Ala-D-Ala carboxypeptidase